MDKKYKVLHLFCGIGGGSLGFGQAKEEYRGITGRFENICGIDADPQICEDYRRITGSRCEQIDLFDREQYTDFFDQEPPEEWEEMTPNRLRERVGEIPDVVFLSPPCKGFSGLLSEKNSKTKKYQALNKLTVRSVWLTLEAYKEDLPALLIFENVPRITTRGKHFLDEIKKQLKFYGYEIDDQYHDCGTIGGLAQSRKRYLMIARNPAKLDSFVYLPPEYDLKTVGSVLETLPLPGEKYGKMHQLPKLQWKTWVRLALIPAGGDWRDLETLDWENYRINQEPISDPRTGFKDSTHHNIYRVNRWDTSCRTVTGAMRPNNGAICISDPRVKCKPRSGVYGVLKWDEAAKTITASADVHAGTAAIADPRVPADNKSDVYIIISEDGSWHRPLTTLELSVLQGFPLQLADGSEFALEGSSDLKWRERIGNAVPVPAATAIANTMLRSMLASEKGDWLMAAEGIWVNEIEEKEEAALN